MKKILLTTAAVTALSSSIALANTEDVFYVKINGGWDKLSKIYKLKSKNDFFFGLGVGYYLMDNVRTDLVFEHLFKPEHKLTKKENGITYEAKGEGNVNALFLNGYVDLFDLSIAKFYVGAGIGLSQVGGKLTFSENGTTTETAKFKKKLNVGFAGYLGASTEFAAGVNGEVFYSYKHYGKTSNKEAEIDAKYKAHQIGVGVRFDI